MSRVKRGVTKHARHKKVIDAAKGTADAVKTPSGLPIKPSRRLENTPILAVSLKSANFAPFGSSVLTPPRVFTE